MHLLVDPVLLAVPTLGGNPSGLAAEADAFIAALIAWQGEVKRRRHQFILSNACVSALSVDHHYPDTATVRHYLEVVDPQGTYSPQDIYQVIDGLARSLPYLEDYFPSIEQSLALEDKTFSLHPDLLRRLLPATPATAAAFRQALAGVAWLRAARPPHNPGLPDAPDPADLLLLTHAIDATQTSIHADILAEDAAAGGQMMSIDDELPLVDHPDRLMEYVELAELWNKPTQALRYVARQHGIKTVATHEFGARFVETLQAFGFNRQARLGYLEKVYRLCAELAQPGSLPFTKQHHPLGHAGTDGVRHGPWQAFRLWINDAAPGYRLHYWKQGSRIAFMQVNIHSDKNIDAPPDSAGQGESRP